MCQNETNSVARGAIRSEEHTSELQSQSNLVCRLLLEKKKNDTLPYPSAHLPTIHRCSDQTIPAPRSTQTHCLLPIVVDLLLVQPRLGVLHIRHTRYRT